MSDDRWKTTDYHATITPRGSSGMMQAHIELRPHSAFSILANADYDYWIAHRMRALGLVGGSLLVSRENPLEWRRHTSWCQILEAAEVFQVHDDYLEEMVDWLTTHPICQAKLNAMGVAVLINNADALMQRHYVLCSNTDAYAMVADAWKDAAAKVTFPLLHGGRSLSRVPFGGTFRNPLVTLKQYDPASQADLELARTAYIFDYPKYIAGQTKRVDFDTEVSVDEMSVVDYCSDGSGAR
jgi:hypothetical protein